MPEFIKRTEYIKKIKPYIDKAIIKVLVGQRRVGKSYMLLQLMELIKELHPQAHILFINKESYEFDFIRDHHDLMNFIKQKMSKDKKNYIFIDEIQDITDFEKVLRSLHNDLNFDIYCTGSNAQMLSGELSTYLSGRFIEVKIYGLSYSEFLTFHKLSNSKETFFKYIKLGGLPFLKNLELSETIVYDYLRNVYNTIMFKDIISRYQIRNVSFLESLVKFLADNVGSLVSAKRISDFLKSQKIAISPNLVIDYLSYICSSYFVYKVQRSEIGGKKIFEIGEKYYFEDLGLRHTLIPYSINDINKVLENIVYRHLIFLGYTVTVGKSGHREIDFICTRGSEKLYIQTSYLLSDEKVMEREFGNLLSIQDNYPKMVLSMDEVAGSEYKGIEHRHIIDFLLNFRGILKT